MRFEVKCTDKACGLVVWIRGSYDPETNAVELDDEDDRWAEACAHIAVGDYEIGDSEAEEDES